MKSEYVGIDLFQQMPETDSDAAATRIVVELRFIHGEARRRRGTRLYPTR